MKEPLNKYFLSENLENILSQLGHFYIPSKSNKIIIKKFFHSFPFFFFDVYNQYILYKIIKNYQITSYIDNSDAMKQLCYNIYKDYTIQINLKPKSKYDFYNDLILNLHHEQTKIKQIKRKYIHSYIFFILIVGLICIYFLLQNKLN